jgi:anti-anti-sigma factor
MELDVSIIEGTVTRVSLNGRLDAAGADRIDMRFTVAVVAPGRPAVVDLSGVSFLASMGIRLLISAARGLHTKGTKLVLFGANELVQDVLDQAALDQIIPITTTEALALDQARA